MTYIHATGTTIIKYPLSRADLSITFPNVSFPSSPTAEDLAPFDVFPVATTPRPADTRDERAIESDPILTDSGWQQTWTTRPATEEETAAWDVSNQPEPDWMGFGIELASSAAIAALFDAIPGPISNGLSIGLSDASKGDPRLFIGLWSRLTEAGAITTELLAIMGALAERFNLPSEFIAELMPAQAE